MYVVGFNQYGQLGCEEEEIALPKLLFVNKEIRSIVCSYESSFLITGIKK